MVGKRKKETEWIFLIILPHLLLRYDCYTQSQGLYAGTHLHTLCGSNKSTKKGKRKLRLPPCP